jgi:hypothetical protein
MGPLKRVRAPRTDKLTCADLQQGRLHMAIDACRVTTHKPLRLPTYHPTVRNGHGRDRCLLSAAALTETVGDRLVLHRNQPFGAGPGSAPTLAGPLIAPKFTAPSRRSRYPIR